MSGDFSSILPAGQLFILMFQICQYHLNLCECKIRVKISFQVHPIYGFPHKFKPSLIYNIIEKSLFALFFSTYSNLCRYTIILLCRGFNFINYTYRSQRGCHWGAVALHIGALFCSPYSAAVPTGARRAPGLLALLAVSILIVFM